MGVMNWFKGYLGLQEEEEVIERYVEQEEDEFETARGAQRKNKGNVIGLPTQKPAKMVLSEPRSYDETQQIADHLRARRAVVVNLQRVRSEIAVRIVDFLSGTVYALNGSISKIGANIFLCAPDTVEIQGAITEAYDGDYENMR